MFRGAIQTTVARCGTFLRHGVVLGLLVLYTQKSRIINILLRSSIMTRVRSQRS